MDPELGFFATVLNQLSVALARCFLKWPASDNIGGPRGCFTIQLHHYAS